VAKAARRSTTRCEYVTMVMAMCSAGDGNTTIRSDDLVELARRWRHAGGRPGPPGRACR
jgi:hypothetical protein